MIEQLKYETYNSYHVTVELLIEISVRGQIRIKFAQYLYSFNKIALVSMEATLFDLETLSFG